ncbi:polysaccharide lyase family 7 protein [Nonlabens agnitus]|uniref:Alginate lyase 2 domain-containing protein n=1 Tax=Nonlabens agnitus TaxID=870484 RepID=A0A2S9WU18_9FLAO|nr:polysaccharide lyase family 7 protein [Nonlabens agnitus]PRP66826.1 hypothetical protein BST86_06770 [Nonlabens agnitus]
MKLHLFSLLGVFILTACSPKINGVDQNAQDAESAYMLPPIPASILSNEPCTSCNTVPGTLSQFANALKDSKLQRYTNAGTEKIEYKKAEEFCNPLFFTTCDNLMVLTATDQAKDRIEFRQEKDLSLNDQSIMRLQASFQNLPIGSTTKGVTMAQIHSDASGVERPLLRVEYTGAKDVRVVVTDTYVKGAGKSINDFMMNFQDGHELYCKLEIMESGNQVHVYLKNITTGKSNSKTYTVSNKWLEKDGDFYFKTGAYLQESGSIPIVRYQSLSYYY